MRTYYGFQVDAWGALLMDRASQGGKLEREFEEKLQARGIENLSITKEVVIIDDDKGMLWTGPETVRRLREKGNKNEGREHLVVTKDLGEGDLAKLALRIAPHGKNDLEISWRLFEENPKKDKLSRFSQEAQINIGLGIALAGVCSIPFGFGILLVPAGIAVFGAGKGWWSLGRKKSSASTYHQFDAMALAQTADFVLMRVLADNNVSAADLRVIKKSSTEGIGQLMKTDPMNEMK